MDEISLSSVKRRRLTSGTSSAIYSTKLKLISGKVHVLTDRVGVFPDRHRGAWGVLVNRLRKLSSGRAGHFPEQPRAPGERDRNRNSRNKRRIDRLLLVCHGHRPGRNRRRRPLRRRHDADFQRRLRRPEAAETRTDQVDENDKKLDNKNDDDDAQSITFSDADMSDSLRPTQAIQKFA